MHWDDPDDLVVNPPKLLREARLATALLDELRRASLDGDEAARRRFRDQVRRLLVELGSSLSESTTAELAQLVDVPRDRAPGHEELLIVQAQIVGWLKGLLSGMELAAAAEGEREGEEFLKPAAVDRSPRAL